MSGLTHDDMVRLIKHVESERPGYLAIVMLAPTDVNSDDPVHFISNGERRGVAHILLALLKKWGCVATMAASAGSETLQ